MLIIYDLFSFDKISTWSKEKNLNHETLDAICIRMIEESGNLGTIATWLNLLGADMLPSLDASLAYRLWSEIYASNSPDFIVMVAGDEHIENISRLAASFATPLNSIDIASEDSSISPEQLERLLFESLPQTQTEICCVQ